MKLFIGSDIHGSAYWCERMIRAFERENADNILLLGDILYHGPRNDLPDEYAPKEVIAMLNPLSERIMCVRGNCEAEVDQMVLTFPIFADYALISDGPVRIYSTHGHVYGEDNPPPMAAGSVLLCGHTHVPALRDKGSFTYMNPGSVSIPKGGSVNSYMTYDGGVFVWHDIETGKEYDRWEFR